MKKNIITKEEVREYFYYDNGKLYNRIQRGKAKIDKYSANTSTNYTRIFFKKKYYSEHILIWIYHYGTDFDEIDHINGNSKDNRISNLRNISHTENMQNQKLRYTKSYTSIPGVFYEKKKDLYRVRLNINGIYKSFGVYNNVQDAEQVCIEMRRKYYPGNTL